MCILPDLKLTVETQPMTRYFLIRDKFIWTMIHLSRGICFRLITLTHLLTKMKLIIMLVSLSVNDIADRKALGGDVPTYKVPLTSTESLAASYKKKSKEKSTKEYSSGRCKINRHVKLQL